ncbi:putative ABM domain-containing protein [Seiridium unicorne]|uniref:ABM domain-containing protein n=1 Tax=Seiridium unicorne TaxID=138068 RepID=A0ABR2UF62_9PEZI
MPNDCEGLPVQEKVARMKFWTAWATLDAEGSGVDNQMSRQGHQVAQTGKQSVHTIDCEFRRWDGYGGTTQEREEASARSPEARKSWTQAVAKVVPLVTAWKQKRWDIQLAPSFIPTKHQEENYDEEPEYTQALKDFVKYHQEHLSHR